MDGKPGEQDDWNRVGHVASKPTGQITMMSTRRGQGVVPDHLSVPAGHEAARSAVDVVGQRTISQVVIEARLSAVKRGYVVILMDRPRVAIAGHGSSKTEDSLKSCCSRGL